LIATKTLSPEEVLKAVAYFISQHVNEEFEGEITCKWSEEPGHEQEIEIYIVENEDVPDILH